MKSLMSNDHMWHAKWLVRVKPVITECLADWLNYSWNVMFTTLKDEMSLFGQKQILMYIHIPQHNIEHYWTTVLQDHNNTVDTNYETDHTNAQVLHNL